MGSLDIVLLLFGVLALAGAALYFLNRWAYKRMDAQQSLIERTKQMATIYVIDKAKVKASESSLPKAVQSQLPWMYKFMKLTLVKAKIGPQIVTLVCDKAVYEALQPKKNAKVELAGMYIVSMPGLKSKKEMQAAAKAKGGGFLDGILSKIKGK